MMFCLMMLMWDDASGMQVGDYSVRMLSRACNEVDYEEWIYMTLRFK